MKITFYHSPLCPRCRAARKNLLGILENRREIEFEEIDVLCHPLKTLSDGIRIFPALKFEERVLSGFFLSKEKIRSFLNQD
jgi:glutaredoxin